MAHHLIHILQSLKHILLEAERQLEALSQSGLIDLKGHGWRSVVDDVEILRQGLQSCKTSRDKIEIKIQTGADLEEEDEEEEAIFQLLLNGKEEEVDDIKLRITEVTSKEDSDSQVSLNYQEDQVDVDSGSEQEEEAKPKELSNRRRGANSQSPDPSEHVDIDFNDCVRSSSSKSLRAGMVAKCASLVDDDSSDSDYIKSEQSSTTSESGSEYDDELVEPAKSRKKPKRAKITQSQKHEAKERDKFLIQCPICLENMDASNLVGHIQQVHQYHDLLQLKTSFPRFILPVPCPKCGNWMKSRKQLVYHSRRCCGSLKSYKQILDEVKSKQESGYYLTNQDETIQCSVCYDEIFPIDIVQHYKTAHGNKISHQETQCVKCGEKMPPKKLSHHLRRKCEWKSEPPSRPGPQIHNNDNDKEPPIITDCPICQRKVKTCKMVAHMDNHARGKKHQCPECPKKFNVFSKLERHSKIHSKVKEHLCEICAKAFDSLRNLNEHMRVHSDERPLKCDQCEATFKFRSALRNHIEGMHSSGVQCSQCGKMCSTRKLLKKHETNVHDNVRRFRCPLCDKAFKTSSHLKYHVNTHNNPNSKKRGLNKDKV